MELRNNILYFELDATWLNVFSSSFRREILFDYEQYEYHGTSVSINVSFAIKTQGATIKVIG